MNLKMNLKMKLLTLSVLAATTANALSVAYDPGWDDPNRSMTSVACSDGANGLTTLDGWTTQGQIPHFPNIGATIDIAGWNSPSCGICYAVQNGENMLYILGIDYNADGLEVGEQAMNFLTGGKAVQLGRVDMSVTQVARSFCANKPIHP